MIIETIKVFFSYSHKDEELRDKLATHLKLLQRQRVINTWHDRVIPVGSEWDKQINDNLNEAHIILMLVSADFLASDYCWDVEITQAMQRHATGDAVVIPVILRPCDWNSAPFGRLQAAPKNARPVTTWQNVDEAFLDITQKIRLVAENLRSNRTKDGAAKKGNDPEERKSQRSHGETSPPDAEHQRERATYSPIKEPSFTEKVATLYKLLHYDVDQEKVIYGRNVGLFLTGHFGDMTIYRVIDCVPGQVTVQHIDDLVRKLELMRREYPTAYGSIITGVSFIENIIDQSKALGIQIVTYTNLLAQLLDGHIYADAILRECETNPRYVLDVYVDQFIGNGTSDEPTPAFEALSEWLFDETNNLLSLLGDLGTGKTFLTRMFAYKLAKEFLDSPLTKPLPIFIDLRRADREFSLEGLILTHMARNGLPRVTFDIFQHSLAAGKIILILDGFDEMSTRVSPIVTKHNFNELARSAQGRAKVLLTCRTHYFTSRADEEEVILGSSSKKYESEIARDLYWELTARKGYRISYLRPFNISQIESYVHRVIPDLARDALAKIKNTYNLMELSQRPLLLDMIVKSINKINGKEIDISTLYEIFTDAWVHRDEWRGILSPNMKIQFLVDLAYSLWQEETISIHYTKLINYLHQSFSDNIYSPQDLVVLDNEIRTASFLKRDELGYYGFAHKSFGEFFLARYLAKELSEDKIDCLKMRRITHEVIIFLQKMIPPDEVENRLVNILQDQYKPEISENALVCLYGIRRNRAIADGKFEGGIRVLLPRRVQLAGAQLEQVVLEGAQLPEAELSKSSLTEAILRSANISGSKLRQANMIKVDLSAANLADCILDNADLASGNLEDTDLRGATLRGANLSNANLLNVRIEGADLTDANFQNALMAGDDKSRVATINANQFLAELETDSSRLEYIESIFPDLIRVTRVIGAREGIECDDLLSELIIYIMNTRIFERLQSIPSNIRPYLYAIARRLSVQIKHDEELDEERKCQLPYSRLDLLSLADEDIQDFLYSYENELSGDLQFVPVFENRGEIDKKSAIDTFQLIPSADDSPEISLLRSEIWRIVDSNLSEDLARIMRFRFIDELSVKDIAERENVPARTIQYKINKAKEILSSELADFSDLCESIELGR